MICLGIESSAHTFSCGIVTEGGKILANEKSSYRPMLGKGIIPREASQHHCENAKKVVESALSKANLCIKDIDIIAVTLGAGMPPCLRIGATVARYMALIYNKPIVGVNHQIAHIEIGKLTTNAKDPVVAYYSGANSQTVAFIDGRYRILGEAIDIPLGNAIDVLARELGLPMPGGLEIEKIAKGGKWIELPYIVKGMDLSYSGALTAAIKAFREGARAEDVAYSFQENCFAMLVEVTERAMAHTDKNDVLLVGGVAANKRLFDMLKIMCEERNANAYVVLPEYSQDNGAMIAWTGLLMHKSGFKQEVSSVKINRYWRTDDVDIPYF